MTRKSRHQNQAQHIRENLPWRTDPKVPTDYFETLFRTGYFNVTAVSGLIPPLAVQPYDLSLVKGDDKLDGLVEFAKTFVATAFKTYNSLPPMILVFCERDPSERFEGPWIYGTGVDVNADLTNQTKEAMAFMAKVTSAAGRGLATILLSEAWMVRSSDKEALDAYQREHGTLEHHPDCVESAQISIEHARGTRCLFSPITPGRGPKAPRTLGAWDDRGFVTSFEGRFSELLAPAANKPS